MFTRVRRDTALTRYTIRDFADRCGISVDRLRHFEKMGLIRPERDPLNNYRFYTDYQLLDVQRISLLQSIDVPLKQIQQEKHPDSPPLFRGRVQERITALQQQISSLQTKLNMMMDIEMRMPEMETNHCREWHSMPYYALFYDECRDPGLIADWTKLTPYVLSLGSVAKAQLLDPETADFSTRLGLGIIEKHLYSLPLRKEPPVHYIEAFTGVRCIVRLRDPLYPRRSELQQIFDYIRLRNQSPAGDMLLGIRGSDEDENGVFYYVRVLLPTETL